MQLSDPDDTPPLPTEAVTQLGDVWLLGVHRLVCGDALDPEIRDRLLMGRKPEIVYMDPPYGMNLATDYQAMHQPWSNNFDRVVGDDVPFDASVLIDVFASARDQFWWGADYYRSTIPDGGSWYVWDKRSHGDDPMYDNVIGNHFELCWSLRPHRRELLRHLWTGFHGLQAHGEVKRRIHPTQKPVALHTDLLGRFGKPGEAVVDLYGGSGSTLIACVKIGLAAYLAELAPTYCDVICRRYQDHTGQLPVLEATGAPHDFSAV